MSVRVPLAEIEPSRIAILKPSALGDIVHALPVLTALRRRFPGAQLDWVVNRGYEPLLRGHPHLDETVPFDRGASRRGWWSGVTQFGRFLGELRRRHYDLVLDLQGLLRSGIMSAATGAPRRVGLDTAREGARWFYTEVVPVPNTDRLHAVDRYWQMALALGIEGEPPGCVLPVDDEAREWAEERLRGLPRPWIMVGPGSRWLTKRWPPQHFAALLRLAQSRFGGSAILVGGGDETELSRATCEQLAGCHRDLTGQTTLPQLVAILTRADVMVANDTGPLHVAVALGRPIVAPYTCTKVALNGPYRAFQGAVESTVWCQGSYLKRCGRMECMAELRPERLWLVLHEVLMQWERRGLSA